MSTLSDATHDPELTSWVESANGHADFPIQNLPLGVFRPAGGNARAGIAIGDSILDLRAVSAAGLLPDRVAPLVGGTTLNGLLGDNEARRMLRSAASALLSDGTNRTAVTPLLHRAAECVLERPVMIGDFTDFYTGIEHARNAGRQFRPDNPLLPNYKHMPIAYHGRASSIRPSGEAVRRPNGQRKRPTDEAPTIGPSMRLDYELELGIWIGQGNELGQPIPIAEAASRIAGLCLLNDWSARDIQAWEYQPLGPFQAKNFHTTISPWIVTVEALAPFRRPATPRLADDPPLLPYLSDPADRRSGAFAIDVQASISTQAMQGRGLPPHVLTRVDTTAMYWTVSQMVAHHTVGGCNLVPGDLFGSGTLSSTASDGLGSLLEITRNGTEPITLPGGETRGFLEDGDEVIFTGHAHAAGYVTIGFGECRARIQAAHR